MKIELENEQESKYINSESDIIMHKDFALQKLNLLLGKYIANPSTIDKADKLSYWLEDYCRLLDFEDNFKPNLLKSYSKGDILNVNLGYNIGNEEGGLHITALLLISKIQCIQE